jgi:hypothetical protein
VHVCVSLCLVIVRLSVYVQYVKKETISKREKKN